MSDYQIPPPTPISLGVLCDNTIMQNIPEHITTITFDVGYTLLKPARPEGDVFAEIAAEFGIVLDKAQVNAKAPLMYELYEQLYEQDDSFWSDDKRAVAIWLEMYEFLSSLLGIEQKLRSKLAHAVFEYYLIPSSWALFDDVVPALNILQAQGYKLALISNWDGSLIPVIEGLELGHFFDTIIASADVNMHKPNPGIFELALKRLDASAGETMHVGDHEFADVAGATAVGITPAYINRKDGKTLPGVISISSLEELVPAL